MFSFPILKPSLRFSNVEVIVIRATYLVNDLGPLGTIQAIFVRKERFHATRVQIFLWNGIYRAVEFVSVFP